MAKKQNRKSWFNYFFTYQKENTHLDFSMIKHTVQCTDHWPSNSRSIGPGVTSRTKQRGAPLTQGGEAGGGKAQSTLLWQGWEQCPALSTPRHKMKFSTLQKVMNFFFFQRLTDRTVRSWKQHENKMKCPCGTLLRRSSWPSAKRLHLTAKHRLWLIPNTD